ncbi:hypothetical protein MJ1_0541 [Nanobdella aerobiophila]|uniref:Uncharacterized protein n=1 Tax=Nanobdella aerobiophila TaxID=2586965 RepID=A0A915T048_9ARCH|nr:hypothetical protein MJ1_0541 [Nanobdella aerobiophila]
MNLLDPRFLKIVNYYVVPVDPKPYDPKYGIDGYKRGGNSVCIS